MKLHLEETEVLKGKVTFPGYTVMDTAGIFFSLTIVLLIKALV